MMQMMEMAHSAPNETYEHEMGGEMYQHFATVFVMPSGEMGAWNLKVSIHDMDTDFSSEVQIPVTVHSPEQAKMNAISVDENSSLFISLVSPELPSVGVNDFEITIHERESMMVWPAMTNYTIEIEPEMPAMGHGSPNNVNPVHESMGHYIGEVNFTMTGEWLVHVTIKDGTDVVADTHFTIIF